MFLIKLFQFGCQFFTVQTDVDSPNFLSLERYKRYKQYRFTAQIGKAHWSRVSLVRIKLLQFGQMKLKIDFTCDEEALALTLSLDDPM